MTAKTYTFDEDELARMRNDIFKDAVSHTKPSPETVQRLGNLERMFESFAKNQEKDEEYHTKMVEFMAEFKRLPSVIDDLSKAVASLKEWRATQDGERNTVRVFWTVFGTLIIGAISAASYSLWTLDTRIDNAISTYEFNITK
jgi:hypothetical protein